MGIPTDEIETTNNACPHCFDVDETPLTVIAVVSGIGFSSFGSGATHPPPPNGIFIVHHDVNCDWKSDIGIWSVWFRPNQMAGAGFQIFHTVSLYAGFGASGLPACSRFFVSALADIPMNPYIGGTAHILTVGAYGAPSLQETLELLNMETLPTFFAEPNSMAGDIIMHRFASHRYNTNVKVKQEY